MIRGQFYQNAYEIIQMLGKKEIKPDTVEFYIELTRLNNILLDNKHYKIFASFPDLYNFIKSIPVSHAKNYEEMTKQDLETLFELHYFTFQKHYSFYFHIGNTKDKKEKLTIGNGVLLSYKLLSNDFKTLMKRSQKECFMHIDVHSSGEDKAKEKAIYMAKRNMSIYKLLNQTEWYYTSFYRILSPFYYYFRSEDSTDNNQIFKESLASIFTERSISLNSDGEINKFLLAINNIIAKNEESLNENLEYSV